MQLRDLEYFAVVAQHGNVRRASEALDLSPGALSKSLHRLEKSVHAKLFERTSKGVELTTVGLALFARVRRLRLSFDDVLKEAADLASGRGGHLRVGVSPIESDSFAAAYAFLAKEAPQLTLDVTINDNDVMVPLLRAGQLDLVFNFIGNFGEDIAREHLLDDELVVCASRNHRLGKLKRVKLADLIPERWAVPSREHLWVHALSRTFLQNGFPPPRIALETRSIRLRLQTWSNSNLLGMTSRRMVRQAAELFGLKELPIGELTWPRPVGAMYRNDAYVSPTARRLIELFRAAGLPKHGSRAPAPTRVSPLLEVPAPRTRA